MGKSKLTLVEDNFEQKIIDQAEFYWQEEKAKYAEGLTEGGEWLWQALKLAHSLKLNENYWFPQKGKIEEKATVLRQALNSIHYDNRHFYNDSDFKIISNRLINSLNRLNADLGVTFYKPHFLSQNNTQSNGFSCIFWKNEQEKLDLLANLLQKHDFIEVFSDWLDHFRTDPLA